MGILNKIKNWFKKEEQPSETKPVKEEIKKESEDYNKLKEEMIKDSLKDKHNWEDVYKKI